MSDHVPQIQSLNVKAASWRFSLNGTGIKDITKSRHLKNTLLNHQIDESCLCPSTSGLGFC